MQRQELKAGKKDTRKELAFLIISAVVTITIVSTCSPLYPFNPWDDANCFFTLGRGIIHGMVPYRDLYEQKGPLLYFLYAAAALISEKAFTGAWVLECIAASVYAVFSWKIVKLITDPPKYLVAVMPLFLCIVYTSKLFNFGGNAEELFFPLITILLYVGLKAAMRRSSFEQRSIPVRHHYRRALLGQIHFHWIRNRLLPLYPCPVDREKGCGKTLVSCLEIHHRLYCHQCTRTFVFSRKQSHRFSLGSIFL